MSKGFKPVAMHEKAEEMRNTLLWVLIITAIQHAPQCYIIEQTAEPDGEIQLGVGRLCGNIDIDKAYGLKCKQNSLLPELPNADT